MSVKKWNATKQEAENIVGSQIEAKEIYSTSEVKTNKVWIDGKPIYRKVYASTLPSGAVNGKMVDLSSFISNVDELIRLEGFYFCDSWQNRFNEYVGATDSSSPYDRLTFNSETNIMFIKTFKDYTGKKMRVIFEYTKTTD